MIIIINNNNPGGELLDNLHFIDICISNKFGIAFQLSIFCQQQTLNLIK